ncbi:ester cyclase [Pararhizobium sp. DWP3-4]|uniref:ester cyclase n=1 Tax=Pararhizobium sp. DWP3-4 TaxID=2804565 RepID=UPI003CEC8E84
MSSTIPLYPPYDEASLVKVRMSKDEWTSRDQNGAAVKRSNYPSSRKAIAALIIRKRGRKLPGALKPKGGLMMPLWIAAAATFACPAVAAQVDDVTAVAMAKPLELIVAADISKERRAALLKPVENFYGFWTNGSGTLLSAAIDRGFTDHTLPPGRSQGPNGPAAAAKTLLGAVPDLNVAVVQRLVISDRVVSHLRFTGTFTGMFEGTRGFGQRVDFIATDIVRVRNGRITDNWHLEDNLTFLTQIGKLPGEEADRRP